jgi:hypothetical protein
MTVNLISQSIVLPLFEVCHIAHLPRIRQQCSKRAGSFEQPRNSGDLRVEGREGQNEKMFSVRHVQGIGNGIKAVKVLLKASAD